MACTESRSFTPRELGELLSRDFSLTPVRALTFEEIDNKPGSPEGWLEYVMDSILKHRRVNDPIGVVHASRGLELINGNHRSWVAHEHRIECTGLVFTPVCGKCTEALFLDSINAWTGALGWMYHQQGFDNTARDWL